MRRLWGELMKSDRIGLTMIVASLLVVGAIIGLLYTKQSHLHRDKVRAQGVALARALRYSALAIAARCGTKEPRQ